MKTFKRDYAREPYPDATTAMQHIAIKEALDGKAVDWMEYVSDERYRSGPAVR